MRRAFVVVRSFVLALVGIAALLAPSSAQAQRAVLLPVAGEPALVASHGERALGVVTGLLRGASMEVVRSDAVMSPGQAPCTEPSCVPTLLRASDATMGAGVALWRRADGVQVAIVLVDPEGRQVDASREGRLEDGLAELVTEAMDAALVAWAVRGGVPVRVTGTPAGATITVDRELWGTLSHEGSLSPGTHRFVVSAADHETERREVTIHQRLDGAPEELRFDLRPVAATRSSVEPGGADAGGGGSDDGMVLGLGVGIPLVVLGVAGMTTGITGVAMGTQCVSGCDLAPAERSIERAAEGPAAAWMVVGAAALVGGVVALVVGATSDGRAPVRAGRGGLEIAF